MGNGIALRESDGEKGTALLPLEKQHQRGKNDQRDAERAHPAPQWDFPTVQMENPSSKKGTGCWMLALFNK